ncbi:hypothetical protein [Sinosporangium siamense]|uniref:Uncharacterized protein n=1 Tax=Sinosporangium siamense TaxID=1367973 RepID=A0A919RAT0_9ACTN|nr:hypothetical protein [Sinosporangium siamense]GII90531.1 hypothetical protein Ssi02_07620 [Sinosporangium siamense]
MRIAHRLAALVLAAAAGGLAASPAVAAGPGPARADTPASGAGSVSGLLGGAGATTRGADPFVAVGGLLGNLVGAGKPKAAAPASTARDDAETRSAAVDD